MHNPVNTIRFQRPAAVELMEFLDTLRNICKPLDRSGVSFALIGGLALAMRGVQRATVDVDFLISADDLGAAERLLARAGYERRYRSENVSHYRAPDPDGGRIDILHAFRAHARGMLQRATRIDVGDDLSLPVAAVEDLIGLKIQAAFNDPSRAQADWQDIRRLLEAAAHRGEEPDWSLIADYLDVFEQSERIDVLRGWHGKTD